MKQTLEKAAKEYADGQYDPDDRGILYRDTQKDFVAGAEWQAKQMAWINVNDKMPEEGHPVDSHTVYSHTKNVLVLYKNGCIGKGRRIYVNEINKKGWQWSCLKGEDITHWMYIPEL